MTLGSLFDGSGGFPLAGLINSIEPIWASEVEPFPIRVTTKRFPKMRHIGDVSEVNGTDLEPVDIITFGSPCQDMSVAGKRAGLKHDNLGDTETTRSGLFMEAIRIIKEMRENDENNGRTGVDVRPRYAVWENVPGAYSSNQGEDFRVVLEELCKIKDRAISIPKPKDGKCQALTGRMGTGGGNVPIVLDRAFYNQGENAKYDPQIYEDGITPPLIARGPGAVCYGIDQQGGKGMANYHENVCPTMCSDSHGTPHAVCCEVYHLYNEYEKSPILKARDYKDPHIVCCWNGEQVMPTLTANNAGGNQRMPDKDNFNAIIEMPQYIVRRLTPLECCRLQGFPDWWCDGLETENPTEADLEFWREVFETHRTVITGKGKPKTDKQIIKWLQNPYSDSAVYKMWGNGIALPNAIYVLQSIVNNSNLRLTN